jgi:lysophospholipase L1-like esterase
LDKENLVWSSNKFKYYFEPKANIVIKDSPIWLNKTVEYTINSDNLNERYNYDTKKDNNIFRILTLGDSFTFGVNVATKNNFTEVLEDILNTKMKCNKLNKIDVINLAMMGHDIEYNIERYKIRGLKYNEDLIIWFLTQTSFIRKAEYYYEILEEVLKNKQREIYIDNNKNLIDKTRKEVFGIMNRKHDLNLIINEQIEELNGFIDNYNKNIIFIIFNTLDDKYKKVLNNIANNHPQIYIIELPDISNDRTLSFPDSHLNILGHKIFAEEIFKFIEINKIISCNKSNQ